MATAQDVIENICNVLKLDKDKLTTPKAITKEYRDAVLITTALLRKYVVNPKVISGSSAEGKRVKMEVDKSISYKDISYLLKRKTPQNAMAGELKCNDLLKTDPKFKEKYQMVVNLLDNNVNVA